MSVRSSSRAGIDGVGHGYIELRRTHWLLAAVLATFTASLAFAQSGGGYDLHWNANAAGAAAMAGNGGYTLNGTVGQPAAGPSLPMTASFDSIVGGFWSVHANDVIMRSGFE